MDCNLLLVDDEPKIPRSIEQILHNDGYRFFTANCAEDALDVLRANRIDVVVSDHQMPGMSGSQLLSEVQEHYPDTVRIMLSGNDDMDAVVDAVNQGSVYKFVTKPWKNENLRAIVKEAARVSVTSKEAALTTRDKFTSDVSQLDRGCVLVLEVRNPSVISFLDDRQLEELSNELTARCEKFVGTLLCPITRREDTLMVLAVETVDRKQMAILAQELTQPFYLDNKFVPLQLAAGYAVKSADESAENWIKNALIALTATRNSGEATAYTETIQHELQDRTILDRDMRNGFELGEFFLQIQPQVCGETLEIRGAESLCRWAHPTRGNISPVQFIDLAEQTGFIHELGSWVISETCQVIRLLDQRGIDNIKVSFNVSPRQLAQPEWTSLVYEFIRENRIDPSLLEVEITESTIMDNPDHALKILNDLKAAGVSVALDDFGTGHSSLALLNELPIDVLKFDHSLIRNVAEDEASRTLFTRLMEMTHELGIDSIAEGVETTEQIELCQSLRCGLIQGYAFYKPLAVGEFLMMLDDKMGVKH